MAGQKSYIGPMNLGAVDYQVVLLFSKCNPLGTSLSQQCQGLTQHHTLVSTAEEAWERVRQTDQQTVILMDISTNQRAATEQLFQLLTSDHLWLQATLVAVVSNNNQ
jgi:CheY-like chemotaxis protein